MPQLHLHHGQKCWPALQILTSPSRSYLRPASHKFQRGPGYKLSGRVIGPTTSVVLLAAFSTAGWESLIA